MSYLTKAFSDGLVQPPAPRQKKTSRFSKDSEEAKKETKHDSQKCLGPVELKESWWNTPAYEVNVEEISRTFQL